MARTRQEMFDTAYRGLASQGFRQSQAKAKVFCAYRSPDGLKCAAGWLIADDRYDPALEGMTADNSHIVDVIGADGDDIEFLIDLQTAHDDGDYPGLMRENLEGVADVYGLTVPTVDAEAAS